MGREIRKVPAGWEHPKDSRGKYEPLYDEDYESAMKEWLDELNKWMNGEFESVRKRHPDLGFKADEPYRSFDDWHGGSPSAKYYRPRWREEERTHFQMYETVSEGTPVTPAFASLQELEDYLVSNGTFWDDGKGWSREAAHGFCASGYAPSLIMAVKDGAAVIHEPRDGPLPD